MIRNLARVCYKLQDYPASLALYSSLKSDAFDFATLCGLAITCYKAGRFQESYNAYQKALGATEDPAQKSQVLTGMACIAYKFQVFQN